MPRLLTLRRTAAATASTALVFVGLLLPADAATATAPEPAAPACGRGEVTVVVDFNELGGRTRTTCVAGPGTARRLFEEAGVELATATAPGMEGFICRVDGRPAKGPCTRNDSYWSLWWADGQGGDWIYASLGVRELELEPGAYVGFAWHEGRGDADAPDLAIGSDGALEPEKDERTVAAPSADEPDDDGPPAWLLAGGAVVVLGAAGVVPLMRRRRS